MLVWSNVATLYPTAAELRGIVIEIKMNHSFFTIDSPGGSIIDILSAEAIEFTNALSLLSYHFQFSQLKTRLFNLF